MTAEPDLLPCPFCGSENIDPKGWASTNSAGPACDDCGASAGGVSGTLQDNIARWNTRANVAHATAPLQAEIEALRAEVAEWKRVAAAQAKLHDEAEAHAERLAEALRWAERHCPCGARPESPTTHPHIPGCPVGTALHPTAAQEEGNGQ